MDFPRKENRPAHPAPLASPPRPIPGKAGPWTPEAASGASRPGFARRGRGGGKAPFISRELVRSLLLIFLLTILLFSFHSPSSPAVAAGEMAPSFAWPCQGPVAAPFRASTGRYGSGGHAGIDITVAVGSAVRASAPGVVSFAGRTPLGTCVSILHDGSFKTTYVSLGSASVRMGETVSRGQIVGASDGAKDRSSASPHLHFGLFLRGMPVDPLPFLEGRNLDPQECLFLGPWEDVQAMHAYSERHDGGGLFGGLGRGFKAVGRAVASGIEAVGRGLSAAWDWVCDAARAVGRAFQACYRHCLEPWLSPVWNALVSAARWVISNRFVQAVLAGLAAAALICLAVVGIGFAIGASLAAVITAAVAGSVTAVGYSTYYAFAAGDSFSFLNCFLSSLAVGGAAAATCMLFSYMAPLIGSGWSQVGLLGFGKSFLVHGLADSLSYAFFSLVTGRDISPLGMLATFCLGGFLGGMGKLFTRGLLSPGALQAVAAGWLSSGGALLTGNGMAAISAYLGGMAARFARKAAYVLFSGCVGFLGDVAVRALTGRPPSLLESSLCFLGGAAAGGLSLAGGGQGVSGLLGRISGGRIKIKSEWGRAFVGKFLSRGFKEGSSALLQGVRGEAGGLPDAYWWSE